MFRKSMTGKKSIEMSFNSSFDSLTCLLVLSHKHLQVLKYDKDTQ